MLGVLVLLAVTIILLYYYNYYKDPRKVVDQLFVGPYQFPILFDALMMGFISREVCYNLHLIYCKTYNYKPFRVWFYNKPYVVVSDYKAMKTILSSNILIDKSDDYIPFKPWLGQGLLTGGGEKWKRDRKILTPAFHFKILRRFFHIFYSNAEILCEILASHDGEEVFDVFECIEMLTLDNLCNAAMGINIEAQLNPFSDLVNAIKNMAYVIYSRAFFERSDAIFKISPNASLQRKSLEIIHGNDNKILRERKEEMKMKKGQNQKPKTTEYNEKERVAFLDLLLEMQDDVGFSDIDIREQVDTFMFAGHDTTTSALGFIMYSLAEYPDVQEKVYQEILNIFGEAERCPDFNDLQAMKYTEQVIKESLRIYPPVPIIGRKVTEDFKLNEHQYVPKGVDIIMTIAALHRNPEMFPNPDVFDPDRFSPETVQDRDIFAFVPFSAGPRNCIGQKFAMHQMKITIYKIVKKFKLSLSDNPKDKARPRAGPVLQSTNGIMIKVQSRKNGPTTN